MFNESLNTSEKRILIVDDEPELRNLIKEELEGNNYKVEAVGDGGQAITIIQKLTFDVVVADIKMPRVDGLEVLKFVKENYPDTEVIMMTAFGDMQTAIEAMRLKAYDFLLKPFSFEQLLVIIERALEKHKLEVNNKAMRIQLDGLRSKEKIIGKNPAFLNMLDLAKRAALTNSNVLISGESGTGKELVAWYIHNNSSRRDNPYITVNCASIPDSLLESELFGHEKGAFTDAYQMKQGLVEIAKGGSLFLDEIGDISLFIQPKLLRFIETGELRRIGGTHTLVVDVRIIAATNKDLHEEVKGGRFREDLFYRLNVVSLSIPPLRERKDDIPLLIDHFLKSFTPFRYMKKFSAEAIAYLQEYNWPGNIRELEHVVQSSVIFAKTDVVQIDDVPLKVSTGKREITKSVQDTGQPCISLEEMEKIHILNTLNTFNWNQTHTAKALKISAKTLYSKIKKYKITRP
jgi:DNA-binding NtrC family response regulator